jgi:carboxyl-terminal processing protease
VRNGRSVAIISPKAMAIVSPKAIAAGPWERSGSSAATRRRFLSLLAALVMLLSMAACGAQATPLPHSRATPPTPPKTRDAVASNSELEAVATAENAGRNTVSRDGVPTLEATSPASTVPNRVYLSVFQAVWAIVNDTFYDPNFGGLDWSAVHDEYEPLILGCEDDAKLYQLLNHMLWELNVSHAGVWTAEQWPSVEPVVFKKGESGIDVRPLDNQVVITRVEAGSPAEEAGLRPGFIITSIDGTSVEQIIARAEAHPSPPYNDRGRKDILTRSLVGMIYGDPGTCVTLAYWDEKDESHEACVERIQRPWAASMEGIPLPPFYLEFESRRLEGGIGYIRFNTFHPDLLSDMVEAVAGLQDAPGIIIDLRGNPGGDPSVAEEMAAQFLRGQVLFGSFRNRSGVVARTVAGKDVYAGPLVIVIDASSYSASEWFASGMQAAGRAVILGERSPGGATGMRVSILPNSGYLGCPVDQLLAPDGRVLEGYGVIPDIEVALDRAALLQGVDAQLEEAIAACSSPGTIRPREFSADSNGVALHVRVAGDLAAGNVLVAIHGGPGMTLDYLLSLERLAGPDLAVVTYDQRGVGRSSSPPADPGNYTLDKYAEDLDAVRQAIGVDSVHLFGHSWGGIVALRYATQYPERVRSVVLMGSGPPTREQTLQCQDVLVQRITELAQQGILAENPQAGSAEAERGYLPAYFSDPNFWFSPDDLDGAPLMNERTAQVTELTWAANESYDLTADLAGLKLRVLNVWGDDDPVRQVSSPAIITALPNAAVETVVLSHCGHFWHECPGPFFTAIRAFLGREGA